MKDILMACLRDYCISYLKELRKSVKLSLGVASLWALSLASGALKYVAGIVTTALQCSLHHLLASQIQQQDTTSAKVSMLCGE